MKEEEIRPYNVFKKYLELSSSDAKTFFQDTNRENLNCPACDSSKVKFEFTKFGFEYSSCINCRSLYQTPRPPLESFEDFYKNSPSSEYWATSFFPKVAEARRNSIFKPRVKKLMEFCNEKSFFPTTIIDVGAGYGIFLEEWKNVNPSARCIAIEPSKNLAEECKSKGLEVINEMAEDAKNVDSVADLVVCFEVLEHVHNPLLFIDTLRSFVKPGGYLLVTTLGVDGFDIQVLWEESNSISPPHHINFLSIEGFKAIFKRSKMQDINVITPGVLDVDIIKNAFRDNELLKKNNRFITKLIEDENIANSFQDFLIKSKMSSHVWVLSQRP